VCTVGPVRLTILGACGAWPLALDELRELAGSMRIAGDVLVV
jgi:hypothetical protein